MQFHHNYSKYTSPPHFFESNSQTEQLQCFNHYCRIPHIDVISSNPPDDILARQKQLLSWNAFISTHPTPSPTLTLKLNDPTNDGVIATDDEDGRESVKTETNTSVPDDTSEEDEDDSLLGESISMINHFSKH